MMRQASRSRSSEFVVDQARIYQACTVTTPADIPECRSGACVNELADRARLATATTARSTSISILIVITLENHSPQAEMVPKPGAQRRCRHPARFAVALLPSQSAGLAHVMTRYT